ncbi:hypothetical protein LSH36_622g00032 [Paralvinella palmiformis]|uniref:Leucine zipper transcription factor-like protein 1 n=1 Tax=Paralvinella palmiformis TaxID=53620 RepID=A0AAD9J4Z1_9ANNE|nr:hypothetical protein LSH36_622g00032 [Paralvinella palmiformis]
MALGLNEHHQNIVVNYLRFARYQRTQRLRAVDLSFQDLKDSRLIEDTFTIDEVTEMLDGLLSVVRGEVDLELINTTHTNVLLLRQLFQQSEKWHLKLQADISELENRELLEQIKNFEEQEFSAASRDSDSKVMGRLEPLNESGATSLLQMEIERVQDENAKLQERLRQVEAQAVAAQKERTNLQQALDKAKAELNGLQGRQPQDGCSSEFDALRKQMSGLKSDLEVNEEVSRKSSSMLTDDLTQTKHELLKIKEMLEMTEKELEKKVSQTAPFRNLKSMLQKKNEQIKDLRRRLSKYESLDD